MKTISSIPVTASEAKRILSKRGKESELGYEQKLALDHLRNLETVSKKDEDAALAELAKIEGLKEHQLTMVIDMMPKDEDDVKTLFMKERLNIKEDQIKKILDALAKIRSTKK